MTVKEQATLKLMDLSYRSSCTSAADKAGLERFRWWVRFVDKIIENIEDKKNDNNKTD